MRKSIHKTLADTISLILQSLDAYRVELQNQPNSVHFFFFATQYVIDCSPLTLRALRTMALTYKTAGVLLSPSESVRIAFRTFPLVNSQVIPHFVLPNIQQYASRCFVRWQVQTVMSNEFQNDIQYWSDQAMLICPAKQEVSRHHNWFRKDQAANLLNYRLIRILPISLEEKSIDSNAKMPAKPIYDQAIKEWQHSIDHDDKIPVDNHSLHNLPFAPKKNETCKEALQKVFKTIYQRSCRHRQGLLKIYRRKLEKKLFQRKNLDPYILNSYHAEFRSKALSTVRQRQVKKPQNGRLWPEEVPECRTLAAILKHIAEEFIKDPRKLSWGEATVALWIMIWCAKEIPGTITKGQILGLSISAIDPVNASIKIEGEKVFVSCGLVGVLKSLIGRSKGSRPLFKNLSAKELERILKEASKQVLGSEAQSLSPGAFLTPFFLYT